MHPESDREMQMALEEELKQKRIEIAARNPVLVAERLYEYGKGLRSRYPSVEQYRLFHIVAGETPPPDCPNFDFPGDDSVVVFLDRLDKEFPGKIE